MVDDCLINPHREKGEPLIAGRVLLCMNPADAGALGKMAESGGGKRYYIYNSNLWAATVNPHGAYVCGPMVGAPMAVLCLEKLIALGASQFVVYGSCGSLDHSLKIGDILLPTRGVSGEGTSAHYPLAAKPEVRATLGAALSLYLRDRGLAVAQGPVWSTDAPYRETRAEVRRLRHQGVKAVDMEFAALLAVAAYREVSLAAAMVVSDQLAGDSWQSGFQSPIFKQRGQQLRRALFEFCTQDET